MSATPTPTHAILPYQSPNARALQTAGNAAIGFFAAVGVAAIPILINWLNRGDFSRTAVTTLLSLIGTAILGVLLAYATKYIQARGSDTPPTVSADGTIPPPEPPPAVFAPPITAASLRDLLEAVDVLQQWQRPVAPPPAAISHRPAQRVPVTEPSAITPVQQFDAAVKRSHHAAKLPVVPLETLSDH